MEGFLLGLTNGTVCAAYCIPALISYFLKEGKKIQQNFFVLGQFMVGRFAGYLLFSVLAWVISKTMFQDPDFKDLFFGTAYLVLSIMLVTYGISGSSSLCATKSINKFARKLGSLSPALLPLAIGFITGLNICPPFLLALTRASAANTLGQSMLFFIMFFLGTSVYFIPVPLLGLFHRKLRLRTIGKWAVYVMSVFYFSLGIMMVLKGSKIINTFDFELM